MIIRKNVNVRKPCLLLLMRVQKVAIKHDILFSFISVAFSKYVTIGTITIEVYYKIN